MSTPASPVELERAAPTETVFAPVESHTAFEEAVDRIGTAIKLGLLPAGTRLPAERELCSRLGIARSTLRQALRALGEGGYLQAVRGRGGGTFVADPAPAPDPPSTALLRDWREVCDERLAIELGVAVLASERATVEELEALDRLARSMDTMKGEFRAYRQADVRFHVGLAETTGSSRLVTAMTGVQGEMGDLISCIAHPPEVLASANAQHHRLLAVVRARDAGRAARVIGEHARATEHILAGLLPGR